MYHQIHLNKKWLLCICDANRQQREQAYNKFYSMSKHEALNQQRQNSTPNIEQQLAQCDQKCVCQVCTCGKHRCPKSPLPFSSETTHNHFYQPHSLQVTSSAPRCAYKLNDSHYDPDLLKSTYRKEYKYVPCPAAQMQKHYAYQPNTAKLNTDTEYNTKYVANKISVERYGPCQGQYRPNTARFEGKSTYQQEFLAKKTDQNAPKQHYAYQRNNLPFYGDTTYKECFKRYEVGTERPLPCKVQHMSSTGRFYGESTYCDAFKNRERERPVQCLVEKMPLRPYECSPGKKHVHYCAQERTWK